MINIRGMTAIEDVSYRYKMPRLETKIEGRGNGIKTVVPNVAEVAEAIHRPATELTKFFGCELGAQTILNVEDNRYIVNGAHQTSDLQNLTFKYIQLFVLCPQCHLPETVVKIKSGNIYQKCAACGAKEMVDMSHKLCTFILNADKKKKRESGGKKSKEERRAAKAAKAAENGGEDAEEDEVVKKKKKKKSEKKDKKEKKKKKKKDRGTEEEDAEDEKGDGEADEEDVAGSGADEDEDEDEDADDGEVTVDKFYASIDEAAGIFRAWMTENSSASVDEMCEQLLLIQISAPHLDSVDRLLICLTAFLNSTCWPAAFTPPVVMAWCVQQLDPHEQLLQKLAGSETMKRYLIGALMQLCCIRQPLLRPHFPVVLKALIEDVEVFDEDDIIGWASEPFDEAVMPKGTTEDMNTDFITISAPLLNWLTADEDDDESDEDDEDD